MKTKYLFYRFQDNKKIYYRLFHDNRITNGEDHVNYWWWYQEKKDKTVGNWMGLGWFTNNSHAIRAFKSNWRNKIRRVKTGE